MRIERVIGLAPRGDRAVWSALCRAKGAVNPGGGGQLPWASPAEGEAAPAAALPRAQRVSLVFPAARALVRILDFPAAPPDELREMARLQVDKISPFPSEDLLLAHETLETREDGMRVLLAATPRETIETWAAPLTATGRFPDRVDLDLLALRPTLASDAPAGWSAHILLANGGAQLVLLEDGRLRLYRALLGPEDGLSSPAFAEELAMEIAQTHTALEAGGGNGAAAAAAPLTLWHEDPAPPPEVAPALRARLPGRELTAREFNLSTVIAEGAARRLLDTAGGGADLAPPEWGATGRTTALRRKLLRATAAALLLWAAAAGALLLAGAIQRAAFARAQATLAARQKPADELRRLRARATELRAFGDTSRSALEYLREVSEKLPPGLDLLLFTYQKNQSLLLRGTAPEAQAQQVYDFFESLQKSPLVAKLTEQQVNALTRQGRRMLDFKVTAEPAGGTP